MKPVVLILAAALAISCGGGAESPATSTVPTPTPPPATTPAQPASVTGRWVGVTPDGMIIDPGAGSPTVCDIEFDLQLDLTQSGSALAGTAITTLRKLVPNPFNCGRIGDVERWPPLKNGTVGSGTISFSLDPEVPSGATIDFAGTFTGTRMSGTLVTFGGRRGTFALNRQ